MALLSDDPLAERDRKVQQQVPALRSEVANQMDTALGVEPRVNVPQLGERSETDSTISEGIVVTLNFASWNQIGPWLSQIDGLRRAA